TARFWAPGFTFERCRARRYRPEEHWEAEERSVHQCDGALLGGPATDEVADLRVDHLAELASAENSVMSHALGEQMLALLSGQASTQPMRRFGLTVARNVVELAFDGEQGGIANRGGLNERSAHFPLPLRQEELLEDDADRVEVVLGGHVEHRVVFVVEAPMRLSAVAVPDDQMIEELAMSLDVTIRVHRHEREMLQEARIHAPHEAGVVERHPVDHLILEPGVRPAYCQFVYDRR